MINRLKQVPKPILINFIVAALMLVFGIYEITTLNPDIQYKVIIFAACLGAAMILCFFITFYKLFKKHTEVKK